MRKVINKVIGNKYIIGCNGATSYICNLNEKVIKELKDIKSVNRAYLSRNEEILCLKSTDTYLAFYNLNTLELLNKISLKKCHQPQDAGACFDDKNFINLQYMDGLVSNIVVYNKDTFEEAKRYSFENKIVLTSLEIGNDGIYLIGFIRPISYDNGEENNYMAFRFNDSILEGVEISKKEYFLNGVMKNNIFPIDSFNENFLKGYDVSVDELKNSTIDIISLYKEKTNS